jgi:regulatory protein
MKITALKLQARNKSRVNVYLDGKFAFGLAKIVAARLTVGQELDEGAIARLRGLDDDEAAYERALRFLATRPRSMAEVRQRLKRQGLAEPIIETVMARLERAGLVNDQAFANFWVENRGTFRPRSQRVLRAELRLKGIADEEARQALAGTNDTDAAYTVAAQRARRLRGLEFQEFRRKLGEHLARRGFDYETIGPIVDRVWTELEDRPPDAEYDD